MGCCSRRGGQDRTQAGLIFHLEMGKQWCCLFSLQAAPPTRPDLFITNQLACRLVRFPWALPVPCGQHQGSGATDTAWLWLLSSSGKLGRADGVWGLQPLSVFVTLDPENKNGWRVLQGARRQPKERRVVTLLPPTALTPHTAAAPKRTLGERPPSQVVPVPLAVSALPLRVPHTLSREGQGPGQH